MIPQVKGQFPEIIDSTIRGEFATCQTKGYWSFIRNLGSTYPSIDLIAGGAFAKGLEVTRLHYYTEGGALHRKLASSVEQGMLAAMEHYTRELGENPIPEFKENKGIDRVISALAAYFEHYNPATDVLQPYFTSDGKPAVEYTFSIPLPVSHPDTGQPIIYAGRFDMLGLYNNQLIGVDEKTTSQLGPTWKNKWNLRGQFTGYTWACRQYGLPVIGCIARGVSFLKKSHGFEESLQLRSEWEIQQWYDQLIHDIKRAIESYTSGWYDQDFNDACAAYSGCQFQRLCTAQNPENWIDGHYAPRNWNPLLKNPASESIPEVKTETIVDPLIQQLLKQEI